MILISLLYECVDLHKEQHVIILAMSSFVRSMSNIIYARSLSDLVFNVIKVVSDLRQVGSFLWFPPSIKLTATI